VSIAAAYDVAPLVMVIRIEKFDLAGKKMDAFVPYSTSLTIMERGNAVAYALHAVVLHTGSDLESGKCATLVQRSRQWYFVDDERVVEIKHIQDVVQREAYILAYVRCL
jgi:ubiquitin C-terminal hydrolase